jgi:hypothetical protein
MSGFTDYRALAVFYAERGFRVLPLTGAGRPLREGIYKTATSDPALAADIWTAPDGSPEHHLVGLETGDLVVIDVDCKKGRDGYSDLAKLKGIGLPAGAVEVDTPSGGKHIYLRNADGIPLKTRLGSTKSEYPGIDFKAGAHGYVVAPGCKKDGADKAYQWTNGGIRGGLDSLPEIPAHLKSYLRRKEPAALPTPQQNLKLSRLIDDDQALMAVQNYLLFDAPAAVEGDAGRDTTLRVFQKCQDIGCSPETAVSLMDEFWNDRNSPPWDFEALRSTLVNLRRNDPIGVEHPSIPKGADAFGDVSHLVDIAPIPPGKRILTEAQFMAGFRAPEYVIDGIIQRGYLYSLTAKTGAGKTAVSMLLAALVGRGMPVGKRVTEPGAILYLAGENSDDIRARWAALRSAYGLAPGEVPIHFIDGVLSLAENMLRIEAEAAAIGSLIAIVVDTAAAYFPGDDTNSNSQQAAFARLLRRFTEFPGNPSVIVPSHPVKNASRENLLPMGGSAFLNEVDGNLTLWNDGDGIAVLHWAGKFRGPEFEPISFALETRTCPEVIDARGRQMPSVVAHVVSEAEADTKATSLMRESERLLAYLVSRPKASVAEMAAATGAVNEAGEAKKSTVHKRLMTLRDAKLVSATLGKWSVTPAGRAAAQSAP